MASSSDAKTGAPYFSAIFAACCGGNIVHAGKVDLSRRGHLRINARMFLAQRADPQHGDFKFLLQQAAVFICPPD